MESFQLISKYRPTGDQPRAIRVLTEGINNGLRTQVLLGVTGSGKTYTMANVIAQLNRPTLIMAHNKVLAAQLCNEFREFFPHNRVEFFVSYYDYYQPEAYIPQSDTYIEKDLAINDEIDKLRHSATSSLFERRDTIVVSSVSCIYGLGAPEEYYRLSVSIRPGQKLDRDALIRKLVGINYKRNDMEFVRSSFRVRGDAVEIFPASQSEIAVRVDFWGDEVDRISEFEAISGKTVSELTHVAIFPASHYAVGSDVLEQAIGRIEQDLEDQIAYFTDHGKLIEAQRIKERTRYDIEMMREVGYCNGIENYSRYFDGRVPGEPPFTLMDYFPKDFLLFVDESHITLPQVRGMYNGDRARKDSLIKYGFRLPAAYDNRPLNFDEFTARYSQIICVSATPGPYERGIADQTAEQIIRPTGLLDPQIEVSPITGQIDDLMSRIREVTDLGGKVLVTTLTKKTAESLTTYLSEHRIKVRYLHSDIDTLERIEIVSGLRRGDFDVLVGINLLREGLDIPEVRLVAILDADKEGFLRSESSLIQTIGRAARNSEGKVVMYADSMTDSMKAAIGETARRREIQQQYNEKNGITPTTIVKSINNSLQITKKADPTSNIKDENLTIEIEKLKVLMEMAADSLDFEKAIQLRDELNTLKARLRSSKSAERKAKFKPYRK